MFVSTIRFTHNLGTTIKFVSNKNLFDLGGGGLKKVVQNWPPGSK